MKARKRNNAGKLTDAKLIVITDKLNETDATVNETNTKLNQATKLLDTKEKGNAKFLEKLRRALEASNVAKQKQHYAEFASIRLKEELARQKEWFRATRLADPKRVLGEDTPPRRKHRHKNAYHRDLEITESE